MAVAGAAVLLLGLGAVVAVSKRTGEPAGELAAGPAWSARAADDMLTITYDRTRPELRDVRRIDLLVSSGARQTVHPLERTAGAVVIPLGNEPLLVRLELNGGSQGGRIVELFRSGENKAAEIADRARTAPPQPAGPVPPRRISMVMSTDNSSRRRAVRLRSGALAVMPTVPPGVFRAADVEFSIKVNPEGRVMSVATPGGAGGENTAIRRAAEDALLQWRFDPARGDVYRNGRVRFRFSPSGVQLFVR